MKKKIKPSILSGFMELCPKQQMIFNDIVAKMIRVYEQNGCMPMDTPLIEKEEILLAKSAGETEKQVYRIDKEKTKQALRFDLTVPFARYVVQNMNELTFPFKRYQIGKVYRGERNQKGRYREFYQLDIDIVNPIKLAIANDAFVMSLAAQAFQSIGLDNYVFQISNRKILSGLLEWLGIACGQEVMGAIDKYDKVGRENCLREIETLIGQSDCTYIADLLQISGDTAYRIQQLRAMAERLKMPLGTDEVEPKVRGYLKMLQGINELEEVVNTLKWLGVEDQNFKIALKIVRGLDYYTGTIFETIIEGSEGYGSICSGGRYDDLAALYTDIKMPGVGISIGITRLFFVLKEIGFLENYSLAEESSYLLIALGNTLKECIEINQVLQRQGIKSEIYLNQDSLKKQLKYADTKEIAMVVIVGEDELKEGKLVVKNMKTGEQIKVDRDAWLSEKGHRL
ncbi:MAG: histidine--tRNA ligase [Cellulosilyticaceae bacterium]